MTPTGSSPSELDARPFADAGAGSVLPATAMRLSELSGSDWAAWGRLADRAAEPNPFFRPGFVGAAAAAHGTDPLLLVVENGGRWLACLPVEYRARWRRLQLSVLGPWSPDLSFLCTPLIDADYLAETAGALAAFVAGERRHAALVLDPIDPDGPVGRALWDAFERSGRTPVVCAEWERGALRRRPEATYVEDSMSAKRRKELRRLMRALGRELGGTPVTVDRSDEPRAWEEFLRLERMGWKGDAGTALSSSPEGASFFRDMCAAAALDGRLQMLSLEVDGQIVSMQCNLLDGSVLFGYKVAYDHELARFSPGALLEVEAIGVFHDSAQVNTADSCAAPDSGLINRIWPDRRRLQAQVVPTGSRRAALIGPNLAIEAIGRRIVRSARARLRANAADAARS